MVFKKTLPYIVAGMIALPISATADSWIGGGKMSTHQSLTPTSLETSQDSWTGGGSIQTHKGSETKYFLSPQIAQFIESGGEKPQSISYSALKGKDSFSPMEAILALKAYGDNPQNYGYDKEVLSKPEMNFLESLDNLATGNYALGLRHARECVGELNIKEDKNVLDNLGLRYCSGALAYNAFYQGKQANNESLKTQAKIWGDKSKQYADLAGLNLPQKTPKGVITASKLTKKIASPTSRLVAYNTSN